MLGARSGFVDAAAFALFAVLPAAVFGLDCDSPCPCALSDEPRTALSVRCVAALSCAGLALAWNAAPPSLKSDDAAPGCGPAPAGMTVIPGSCMGNPRTCKGSSCDCAANVQLKAGNCGASSTCFTAAKSACAADRKCKSFAVLGPPCSNYTEHLWQTYSVGSANAVRNTPWTTFAMHSDSPAEPPPPPPPPPAPPPAPQWEPRSPCVDDTDCAMLGKCGAGKCSCSSGWSGPSCQTLDLLPADPVGAFGWAPNVSAWGAHVLTDKSGEYHMYAAELVCALCCFVSPACSADSLACGLRTVE
eukprot:SAG11_NODE_3686_length_2283_cov_3.320055_3_plen_302_part_00